jgi:hypothetical protein
MSDNLAISTPMRPTPSSADPAAMRRIAVAVACDRCVAFFTFREARMRSRQVGMPFIFSLVALAILGGVCVPGAARAQADYPNHPVRIIVPYGAGGIADVTMRLTAQKLS